MTAFFVSIRWPSSQKRETPSYYPLKQPPITLGNAGLNTYVFGSIILWLNKTPAIPAGVFVVGTWAYIILDCIGNTPREGTDTLLLIIVIELLEALQKLRSLRILHN